MKIDIPLSASRIHGQSPITRHETVEAAFVLKGMAVTESVDGETTEKSNKKCWNVTHIKSGCKMPAWRMFAHNTLNASLMDRRYPSKAQTIAKLKELDMCDLSNAEYAEACDKIPRYLPR